MIIIMRRSSSIQSIKMWTGSLFFFIRPPSVRTTLLCKCSQGTSIWKRVRQNKMCVCRNIKKAKNWEEAEASVKRYGLLYHDLFLSESQLRVQLVLSLSSRQISFSCWAAGTACYIMSTVHALVVLWDKVKAPSWRQRSCVCVPSKHHENTSHSTCWSNLSVLLS